MPVGHPTETWLPISGFRDYEVSDLGRVRTCKPPGRSSTPGPLRLLKPTPNRRGYLIVSLWRNGKDDKRYVHRLVLEAFVGPAPPGTECRHVTNRDPSDNRLCNLTWGSRRENQADRKKHGTDRRGEGCRQAKLTRGLVAELKRRWHAGESQTKMAAELGVRRENVWKAIHGVSWAHVV